MSDDDDRVMTALSRRVPITLLCDLVEPSGLRSREIYAAEREEDEGWWLQLAYPALIGGSSYPLSSA